MLNKRCDIKINKYVNFNELQSTLNLIFDYNVAQHQ